MRDPKPADLAGAAADAVQMLVHATLSGGYETPADLDEVLSELYLLVGRMPQALRQAASWLAAEEAAGRVGSDDDFITDDGYNHAQLAVATLASTAKDADHLVRLLDIARQHVSHLSQVQS